MVSIIKQTTHKDIFENNKNNKSDHFGRWVCARHVVLAPIILIDPMNHLRLTPSENRFREVSQPAYGHRAHEGVVPGWHQVSMTLALFPGSLTVRPTQIWAGST